MTGKSNKTVCRLCGSKYSENGISRHLTSCLKQTLDKHPRDESTTYLHLLVRGLHRPEFFLHLLVMETITFKKLDRFLRDIWLECCGHMSGFWVLPDRIELSKGRRMADVFHQVSDLLYEYDFGDTTALSISCKGRYAGCTDLVGHIVILSRNNKPIFYCDECESGIAEVVCTECQWDSNGFLCRECAKNHPCDSELILPISNSPRFGVCAYVGEDEKTDKKVFADKTITKQAGQPKKTKKGEVDLSVERERLRLLEEMIRHFYKDCQIEEAMAELELHGYQKQPAGKQGVPDVSSSQQRNQRFILDQGEQLERLC